jgi:two-component system, NtrC family, response regulator HydG
MPQEAAGRILIIDDDASFRALWATKLGARGYCVESRDWLEVDHLSQGLSRIDVVLLDRYLDNHDALDLLSPMTEQCPSVPVVLMTASSSVDVAVEAMRMGAFDFLPKPLDEPRLLTTLARAVQHARLSHRLTQLERSDGNHFEGLVGTSAPMRSLRRVLQNIAPTETSVLITGESGTGKELVARAIHARSRRSSGPFIALNMAALPKELIESTLFGHEKGAFTGADRSRTGMVEQASSGTLFLDEIGEMPGDLQPKLLRFLQERTIRRIGGDADIPCNVRIISATNREPIEELRRGTLREDLFYRLNVVPVRLPPLRDRGGDVELLAHHFLRVFGEQHASPFSDIHPDAMKLLEAAPWPGNVRQLAHLIERIVVLHRGPTVTAAMIPHEQLGIRSPQSPETPQYIPPSEDDGTITPLEEVERRTILRALYLCKSSASKAAIALGISDATIYRKLKRYRDEGIDQLV